MTNPIIKGAWNNITANLLTTRVIVHYIFASDQWVLGLFFFFMKLKSDVPKRKVPVCEVLVVCVFAFHS